ncbi:hypothetical protein DPEC_G00314080 [Dallia pectoralis]|uniref:Uncharacterized protein n=1 Tax=Dallia pectoralis TaxID=75939 RepID=A0ACC2FCB5_DALPE|nr:hypothetical protein DPEC_G00314080 [Dallia pectoralis]
MARRKEVFQSKVLQRLYPLPSNPERDPSPPTCELIKNSVKPKVILQPGAVTGDGELTGSSIETHRRVYTVLAAPAEYKTGAVGFVTLVQPSGINTEDPAGENAQESDEDKAEEQPCRRRRRKRKGTKAPGGGTVPGSLDQATDYKHGYGTNIPPPVEDGEQVSKNRRRKLKKKRHKEKLLSLGLVPRAEALEFTYLRQGCGKEEEAGELTRAAVLVDNLRTTKDLSERLQVSEAVDGLVTSQPQIPGAIGPPERL